MPLSIPRLRIWFAVLALAAVAVVGGFYLRARMELRNALRDLPGKVGIDIQQTSEGFTMSKSEGGRTLFTIHASKATQFKEGGHATLHNVNIIVYGRQSDRFDQIYGDDFDYDQKAGTVVSKGLVHIDLQGNTVGSPGTGAGAKAAPNTEPQKPPSLIPPSDIKNAIHLWAEGMTFNQKTGLAESQGRVEFQVPQAVGTAQGATYDSKNNQLTLHAAVDITTDSKQPTHILAHSGAFTKEPRLITMQGVQMTGQDRTMLADDAIVHLAEDNSVQRVNATGNVRLSDAGGIQLRAPKGELMLGAQNTVESAFLTGGVDFESATQAAAGHSGEMRMHFVPQEAKHKAGSSAPARLQTIYASQGAILRQAPRPGSAHPQALTMTSDAMTFALNGQQQLTSAETAGPGELITRSADPKQPGQTVIDAQHFTADFGEENRLRTMHSTGAVKVTSSAPGEPDKVSTSQTLVADFSPAGEITRAVQEGDFRYKEAQSSKDELGGRRGWAERASYSPQDQSLTLTGSNPRVVDGGTTVEADNIRLLRGAGGRSAGEIFATGNVKSTYSELTAQPNGALLANSDPVHVTAKAMNALQSSGLAHYTGGSRLWQGSNIVEGQAIDFDQKSRTILAQGDPQHPVSSLFLQVDAKGKSSTMLVTAPKLNYSDNDRQAHYSGGVTVKSEDGVMTAAKADVFLIPASAKPSSAGAKQSIAGPSQLDHIVATTHVVVRQQERRAEGEKLVYQASTGTYVITGGSPTLSDPVNGTVRGDSLTFYNRDDRVVVEGSDSTRSVTHTHVSR
jgi:lipopolysaccharide export system protein LptA